MPSASSRFNFRVVDEVTSPFESASAGTRGLADDEPFGFPGLISFVSAQSEASLTCMLNGLVLRL